jgi:plastocyanin
MPIRLLVITIVAAGSALLVACGDDEESTGDSQTIAPSAVTVKEDIEVRDFSFSPASLEATLGNTVELSLKNEGEQDHTFTIDEFVVDEELPAGEESSLEFTPNEPGEFNYYCRFHPDRMQGSIRIARPGEAPPGDEPEPTEDSSDGGGFGY